MALYSCEAVDEAKDPNIPNCACMTMIWPKRIMIEKPYSYVDVRSVSIAKMETYVEICFLHAGPIPSHKSFRHRKHY